MSLRLALATLLLTVGTAPAVAQTDPPAKPRSAKESADAFTLDAVTPEPEGNATAPPDAAPDALAPDRAIAPPPAADAARVADPSIPDLDTPIAALIANYRTKAVLDRDLPGLTSDENLPKFSKLSLRKFQPLTGGQLTGAMLAKLEQDLAATHVEGKPQRRVER